MRSRDVTWVISMENGARVKCLRCDRDLSLVLPQPLACWLAATKAFLGIHKHCKQMEGSSDNAKQNREAE